MLKTAYLFLDTNLFIQCRPLAELDWSPWADFDILDILIVRPVQAELDRQKKGQGRVAKRARAANSMLAVLLESDYVEIQTKGPRVRVLLAMDLRRQADLAGELDYEEKDDQLVGIAAAFSTTHPDASVELLSADIGVLATAKRVDLCYRQIPDAWLLPAETDAEEKQVRALTEQLERYQRSEPKLVVRPPVEKHHLNCHTPLTPDQVSALMARLEQRFPMATNFEAVPGDSKPVSGLGNGLSAHISVYMRPSEDEIAKYQETTYPGWLQECKRYFERLHSALDYEEGPPEIEFEMANIGSRPASDAIVTFEAKGAFSFYVLRTDEEQARNRIGLPPPPKPPTGRYEGRGGREMLVGSAKAMRPALPDLSRLTRDTGRDPNGFYWSKRPESPQRHVSLVCAQWRHQIDPKLFRLKVHFPRKTGTVKGAVEICIHAANLTDPFSITCPVIFEVIEAESWTDAEALVESL